MWFDLPIQFVTLQQNSNPGKVKFFDEIQALRWTTTELKRQGVKIFIALGHSGFEVDKRIAKSVPLIDVVVGGHTNTFLYNVKHPSNEIPVGAYPYLIMQPRSQKLVPVVQAFAYTKYLGDLQLVFNKDGELSIGPSGDFGGNPILLDQSMPEDEAVLKALEPYKKQIDAMSKGYSIYSMQCVTLIFVSFYSWTNKL